MTDAYTKTIYPAGQTEESPTHQTAREAAEAYWLKWCDNALPNKSFPPQLLTFAALCEAFQSAIESIEKEWREAAEPFVAWARLYKNYAAEHEDVVVFQTMQNEKITIGDLRRLAALVNKAKKEPNDEKR